MGHIKPKEKAIEPLYDNENQPEKVDMADAFTALALAVLMDGWTSSDSKILTFYSMEDNLKAMGYDERNISTFKRQLAEAQTKFLTTNDFMG